MNDNAYQRLPPSASPTALTAVQVETPSPGRRRTNSKSKVLFWKLWRRTWRPTINIDRLVRMRLRWRTVAKVLGGILFFKITLSMIGSLVGTEPNVEYMVMPDGASARNILSNDSYSIAANTTVAPPPPPPPIPPPVEAIKCENLQDYAHMVARAPEVDEWQTIQLGISFGFSAYFDDRLDGVVAIKVMALADEWLDATAPVCQLWFSDRVEPFALPANVTNFPAQPTARYKTVMYACAYKPTDPEMPAPVAVSMSSEACTQPLNMFKLHLLDRSNPPESRQKIAVCLASPMRLNFSEPGEMVDWIEVHKIFGVSKYIMYEHDVAENVHPYMQHYIDDGTMDVVQWKLPSAIRDPRESIKAFGQLAMINDCLYRNMFKSKYLVFLDLDEMMVPRGMSKTLEEVLVTTACQDKAQTIIRSAFFRKQWTNDEKYASDERMVKRSLVSLLKTKRERKVLAINVHAKYIVIPEMIDALETLAALRFLPTVVNNTGEATCIPLAKECLLHHYRYYEEFTGDWMIDRKLHEFTKLIVERTGAVFESVAARIAIQQQVLQAALPPDIAEPPPGDPAGAPADAPVDMPPDAPAGDQPGAPVDTPPGAPAGDQAGAPVGIPPGAPASDTQDTPVDVPEGDQPVAPGGAELDSQAEYQEKAPVDVPAAPLIPSSPTLAPIAQNPPSLPVDAQIPPADMGAVPLPSEAPAQPIEVVQGGEMGNAEADQFAAPSDESALDQQPGIGEVAQGAPADMAAELPPDGAPAG